LENWGLFHFSSVQSAPVDAPIGLKFYINEAGKHAKEKTHTFEDLNYLI